MGNGKRTRVHCRKSKQYGANERQSYILFFCSICESTQRVRKKQSAGKSKRGQTLKRMSWKYNDSHSNNKPPQFLIYNFAWNTRREMCRLHIVAKMTHFYEMYVCLHALAYPHVIGLLQKSIYNIHPKLLASYCLANKWISIINRQTSTWIESKGIGIIMSITSRG